MTEEKYEAKMLKAYRNLRKLFRGRLKILGISYGGRRLNAQQYRRFKHWDRVYQKASRLRVKSVIERRSSRTLSR